MILKKMQYVIPLETKQIGRFEGLGFTCTICVYIYIYGTSFTTIREVLLPNQSSPQTTLLEFQRNKSIIR